MRLQQAIIGGLLLIVLGVALGATVFRTDIAQATGLAQSVTIDNTSANPVPVREQGTVNVNVTNTAKVQAAIPVGAFSFVDFGSSGETAISGPDPAGTSYAITSLTVENLGAIPHRVIVRGLYGGNTSDCTSFPGGGTDAQSGPEVVVPANDTVHVDFPQPFTISAGSGASSCLTALASNDTVITVVGYSF